MTADCRHRRRQVAVLPEMVLLVTVRVPPKFATPPPLQLAVLPEMVLFVMVRVPMFAHRRRTGGIARDGAVRHGEGAVVRMPPPP